ncbi:hypothetical protein [Chitinophaga rhizophila]|uniref:Uncharacterized protein n=1 Tax=Chitinophaga rhizophila TaxID=2866212 RepID=A0ABS7GME2_9BACT|nr:hypothetical protein [Chitinophaga rhizophila]MBW8687992.1 hypothetical protein [Chitinophaga rhizophila]
MKSEKRLALEDFQMEAVNSGNEVEKMLGLAAAGCHFTGPHKNPDGSATLFDYEWGLADAAPLRSNDQLSLLA